jgi:hypothetical protein
MPALTLCAGAKVLDNTSNWQLLAAVDDAFAHPPGLEKAGEDNRTGRTKTTAMANPRMFTPWTKYLNSI